MIFGAETISRLGLKVLEKEEEERKSSLCNLPSL